MSNSNSLTNVNSRTHKTSRLYIYHNLPTGGAHRTLSCIVNSTKYLHSSLLKGTNNKPINFIHYLKIALIDNYLKDLSLSKLVLPSDFLICFQSWLIKTPFILKLAKTKHKVYICHEPPLEYYDSSIKSIKTIKHKLVDILRLPIKWLDYWNIRGFDGKIIVNSDFSKQIVTKAYNKDSIVVYPCISDIFFSRRTKNTDIRKFNVISVGAINKPKGFDLLIAAIGVIPKKNRPVLTIIGNGSDPTYKSKLQKLAIKSNVTIRIRENIKESELIDEYDRSSAFIYAPISEPFGLVVIEAMARGLPIIAYKNGGGYAEILSDNNGKLIDNRDITNWAEGIQQILLSSKQVTRHYKRNNIRNSKKFTSQKYSDQILKLLDI